MRLKTDSPTHNRLLMCCSSDEFLTLGEIFRIYENFFPPSFYNFRDKVAALQSLEREGKLVGRIKESSSEYVLNQPSYRAMKIRESADKQLKDATLKNMLCTALGKQWRSHVDVFASAGRIFTHEFWRYEVDSDLLTRLFWLDQLVVDGRAICQGPPHMSTYKTRPGNTGHNWNFDPSADARRRIGYTLPPKVEPVCPQARTR